MHQQHTFEFDRADLEAFELDELFGAVDDSQIAVLIDPAYIPGSQPALRIDRFGGCRRIVEVAEHHIGTTYQQLAIRTWRHVLVAADFHDPHLNAMHHPADRTFGLFGHAWLGNSAGGGGFGKAPAVEHRYFQSIGGALQQVGTDGRGTGDGQAQARQVEVIDQRMLGKLQHNGSNDRSDCDFVVLNHAQSHFQVESGQHDQARALRKRRAYEAGLSIDMEERQRRQDGVGLAENLGGGHLFGRRNVVAIAEHHRLGEAAGATGEHQGQQVFLQITAALFGQRLAHQQRGKRREARGLTQHENFFELQCGQGVT
ncbi:hypothetical protein D9M71_41370 [compost metagenome]